MDSKCPVIENVDDNSNKDEVTDTMLSSKKEEENNSNELPSVNDNESTRQNQNNDQQEQTRNLVNKSLQGDSLESSSESSVSVSIMGGKDKESEEATNTNKTESESVNKQQSCDSADFAAEVDNKNIYRVKWISYGGSQCGVLTQSENGPCPLISIVNVLSLRGRITLPQGCEAISAEQLLEFLADLLLETRPDALNTGPDFHYNVNDAIDILPKLQTGLDVNVRFTGVKDFEYTPECIIFDLLKIGLYHGWLVDPQLEDLSLAINSMSYNQVVESIITGRTSQDPIEISKSLLAEQFLEESASQLTYHGICELNSVLKDGQLAVFFRNNHFSTLRKERSVLYLLVTDQGFLNQPHVVWETLDNIQGDTGFVDQDFNVVESQGEDSSSPGDRDHLLAVSLQQRDEEAREREQEWQQFKQEHLGAAADQQLSDEELARRLQEVENAAVETTEVPRAGPSQHAPQFPIGPRNSARDKKCMIL